MQKITENVYAETGFRGCNPGFVVTKEGVVMIDTPMVPTHALKWREEIRKHGKVHYLINTEPHIDHFSGNYYFDGTVVAHEGTKQKMSTFSVEHLKGLIKPKFPESLALMNEFSFRLPTITFSQNLTLYLGDHTFQLIHLPGHTPFEVAVYIPEERVVFTSDNVFYKVQAWLKDALPYEWLDSLKRIQELDTDVLVPGHGSICDRSYIPEMSTIIQAWIDTVTAAIEQGISLEEAQSKISIPDPYPMEAGQEHMAQEVPRRNWARMYELLKK